MNRRFLVAFAFAFPLVIFIAAKSVASWRPVAIGKLLAKQTVPYPPCDATNRFVIAGGERATFFDLKTGEARLARNEGVIREKTGVWELRNGTPAQLIVRLDGGTHDKYAFPTSAHFHSMNVNAGYDMVAVSDHYVDLIFDSKFYQWKRDSHQFVRQLQFTMDDFAWAFGPMGDSIIYARRATNIESVSTITGRVERTVSTGATMGGKVFDEGEISTFGNYVAYKKYSESNDVASHWIVSSAHKSQRGWDFDASQENAVISFSPDETLLSAPSPQGDQCEIRELNTGEILRTLPLCNDTYSAAFSPDGATLYSVADGVLYKQRAR